MGDVENCSIEELEEMLFHYSDLLHPNHYILIDIMHNLVHMYAAKATLTRPEKERKIQLCLSGEKNISTFYPSLSPLTVFFGAFMTYFKNFGSPIGGQMTLKLVHRK